MLFGPDVSNYQRGISMPAVRAAGCDFLSAKATQGSSYRSPAYPAQRDQAIAAGLIFWAYHYVDTSDPAAQARNFASAAGKGIACMLDWEDGGGDVANLRRVVAAFTAIGIRVPLVYAPHWYWQKVGSQSLAGLPPLVASSYVSVAGGAQSEYAAVTSSRWAPYGANRVALLQFTDHAAIAGLKVDANAYPGTREQLISLLYGTPATPSVAGSSRRRRYREAANDMRDKLVAGDDTDGRFTGPFGGGSATIESAWVTCSNAVSMDVEVWCQHSINGVRSGFANDAGHAIWHITDGSRPWIGVPDGTDWIYYQAKNIKGAGDICVDIRPKA